MAKRKPKFQVHCQTCGYVLQMSIPPLEAPTCRHNKNIKQGRRMDFDPAASEAKWPKEKK